MAKIKANQRFFWIVLIISLLLSGGHISATAADGFSNIVINEFMAANSNSLLDEDGDSSDWIELYNHSPFAVNLAGWALTDDPDQPQKWMFPDLSLGSGEYLVVFASGKDRKVTMAGTPLHTNFRLSKSGDFLALYNVLEGRFMDAISPGYPEQFRDVSYGRHGEDQVYGYLTTPTPGEPNRESRTWGGAVAPVTFSLSRGFYHKPITVELTGSPEATIRYTTDGSKPTAGHGTPYTGPISIEQTTLLRAAAFKPGYLASDVATQTYLILDDFAMPAPDFLDRIGNRSAQLSQTLATYEAAMTMPGQAAEEAPVRDSVQSLPVLSVVLAPQDLAELYASADEGGRDSELPVSIELLNLDEKESGFQTEAGLRLQATNVTAKPAFRLFFRSEYGPARLAYPLFSDSPVQSFDTLLLQPGPASGDGSTTTAYLRNQWLRNSQLAMSSGLGAHGRFVNLYLNGMYWGLYNLAEKPNADFMASYLGGEKEDWFVADQEGPLNDQRSADVNKLNYLFTSLALAQQVGDGLTQPEYLDDLYAAAAAEIDPAQLIDYTILTWYAQSLDWPAHNWYAAVRLQDLPGLGKFLVGEEAEKTAPPDFGVPGDSQPDVAERLFEVAMQNPDFRIAFADRLYLHLFNNGALTDANAQARWRELQEAIEPGFAAEVARWRKAGADPSQTDEAMPANGRAARLLTKARNAGYYPPLDPPQFSREGGMVEAGFAVTITLPDSACQNCRIYYTTDGTDPRLPFSGDVSPGAIRYSEPVRLSTSSQLQARIRQATDTGPVWSALHEATFSIMAQDINLRITEIMYNPAGGDDYEFVELQNIGRTEIDLAGVSFDEGIWFTFPPYTPPLAAGEFVVLASNPALFAERYPAVAIAGAYEGHLSNKGEKILLKDAAGDIFIEIEYNDEYGWPVSADGRGDSLNLINPAGTPNDPRNWRASANLFGSPGAAFGE